MAAKVELVDSTFSFKLCSSANYYSAPVAIVEMVIVQLYSGFSIEAYFNFWLDNQGANHSRSDTSWEKYNLIDITLGCLISFVLEVSKGLVTSDLSTANWSFSVTPLAILRTIAPESQALPTFCSLFQVKCVPRGMGIELQFSSSLAPTLQIGQ